MLPATAARSFRSAPRWRTAASTADAYCGAKHAIQGFTESLRTELMHDGSNVRMTMVQLPAVNTPQFDWVLSGCRTARSRSRRSTSPRWSPTRSGTPRRIPAGGSTTSVQRGGHHPRQQARRRAAGPVPGPYRLPLAGRPSNPPSRTGRRTCGSPRTAGWAGLRYARFVRPAGHAPLLAVPAEQVTLGGCRPGQPGGSGVAGTQMVVKHRRAFERIAKSAL